MAKPAFLLSPGRVVGAPRYTDAALRVVTQGAYCAKHPSRVAHRVTSGGVVQCAECFAAAEKRRGVR